MIGKKIRRVDRVLDRFVSKRFFYLFVFVLLFGFFLRVSYLDYDSMWIDETISAVAADSILESGVPVLGSGEVYSRAEVFHYLMAFFVFVFGGDFGARFVCVIFGVLTIWLAYKFADLFEDNSFFRFGFPVVVALSSLEIIYSKQARFYQVLQFLYFLSVYFYFRVLSLKKFDLKSWSFFGLVISTLFAIHVHSMAVVLLPLYVLGFLVYKFDFKKFKKQVRMRFLYLAGLVLSLFFVVLILVRYESLFGVEEISRVVLYSGLYLDFFFSWIPILVLSVVGFVVAFRDDWRRHLVLGLFGIVPVLGIFLTKFFATRYVYFAVFLVLFYLIYLLSKLHLKYFVLVAILFMYSSTMFSFVPIKEPRLDFSMPIADYKGAYDYVLKTEEIVGLPIVTTWTPAAMWYGGEAPDYWINYSLSGTGKSWQIRDGVEVYSGAEIIYLGVDFPKESIVVLDSQGARKLSLSLRKFIDTRCVVLDEKFNIKVLFCSR